MTSICIVGNSHVAALKRGWRDIANEYPGITVDMFGASGVLFSDVYVRNGRLLTASEEGRAKFVLTGGRDHAVLAHYDLILTVGASIRHTNIAKLLSGYCPPYMNDQLPPQQGSVEDRSDLLARFYSNGVPQLVSEALFHEIMVARLITSNGVILSRQIAAAVDVPVVHLHAPFPSSEMMELKPGQNLCRLVALGYAPLVADRMTAALASALGPPVSLLKPPANLLVEGIFTDKVHSSGGARLDDERVHDDEDLLHMNAVYGAALMREVVKLPAASKPDKKT